MAAKIKRDDIHDVLFFLFITFLSIHPTDGNIFQTIFSYGYGLGGIALYIKSLRVKRPVFIYTAFWVVFSLLSIVWAQNKADAASYVTIFIKLLLSALVITNRVKNFDDILKIIKLIVFARVICAVVLFIKTPLSDWGTMELGSAIGLWKNDIGLGFTLSAVLAWTLAVSEAKWKHKSEQTFYQVTAIVFSVIAFISGSRKAAAMLILEILIYTFVSERSKMTKRFLLKRTGQILLILAFLGILVYFVMTNKVLYDVLGKRLETLVMYLKTGAGDESAEERTYYFERALDLWKANPLIGAGVNGFVSYMKRIGYSHVAYSHNNFTEVLSTLGIVGLVMYYLYPLKVLIKNNPFRMADGKYRRIYVSLWSLLLIFVVFGFWFVYCYDVFYYFAIIIPCLASELLFKKNTKGRRKNGKRMGIQGI